MWCPLQEKGGDTQDIVFELEDTTMVYIIKKDGTKEEFDAQKIVRAVNKSAQRILYTFSQQEIDFICKFATEHVYSLERPKFRSAICTISWREHSKK